MRETSPYIALAQELVDELPVIGRRFIDAADPRNAAFLADPDSAQEHKPDWHAFGIATHTRFFLDLFFAEVPVLCGRWGLEPFRAGVLAERVEGAAKGELLAVAIALHDVGKFARTFVADRKRSGVTYPIYVGHEERSEAWIRGRELSGRLEEAGLTPAQIDYVARAAGAHYALGTVRDRVKHHKAWAGVNFDFAFVASDLFRELALEVAAERAGLAVETGLLYLGDSLAKVPERLEAETEAETEARYAAWVADLAARGLPLPRHAKAVKQLPVSLAASRRYLEIVRDLSRKSPVR